MARKWFPVDGRDDDPSVIEAKVVVDVTKLNKLELDRYALDKYDIKLDRRESKSSMLEEFHEKLAEGSKKE